MVVVARLEGAGGLEGWRRQRKAVVVVMVEFGSSVDGGGFDRIVCAGCAPSSTDGTDLKALCAHAMVLAEKHPWRLAPRNRRQKHRVEVGVGFAPNPALTTGLTGSLLVDCAKPVISAGFAIPIVPGKSNASSPAVSSRRRGFLAHCRVSA